MLRIRFASIVACAIAAGALVLSAGVSTAQAAIIYVKHDATGTNTGASWSNACVYLQDALTKSVAGDEIWVAAGRYTPDRGVGFTPLDKQARFTLRNGVALYGGFVGTETLREQRDWQNRLTILSADLLGDDTPDTWNAADNSGNVLVGSNIDNGTSLDGFCIRGGYAGNVISGDADHQPRGAGMRLRGPNCQAVIRNCAFERNWADWYGGAVDVADHAAPLFENCTFSENVTQFGAAAYVEGRSSPLFRGCVFVGNFTLDKGAVYVIDSNPQTTEYTTLVNCKFVGNVYGGGSALCLGGAMSTANVVNCTFAYNQGRIRGGAIFIADDCCDASTLHLRNSILWNNWGEYRGDPSQIAVGTSPDPSNPHVVDVEFTCIEGGWPGTGNISVSPQFVNAPGSDGVTGTADDDLRLNPYSPCADAGNNALVPAGVQFDLTGAPRFYDAPQGDTGVGPVPIVDMGAYEFQHQLHPGDMNCDGVVSNFDVDPFVMAIIHPTAYPSAYPNCDIYNADINLDRRVNNFDIDPFVALLLGP